MAPPLIASKPGLPIPVNPAVALVPLASPCCWNIFVTGDVACGIIGLKPFVGGFSLSSPMYPPPCA